MTRPTIALAFLIALFAGTLADTASAGCRKGGGYSPRRISTPRYYPRTVQRPVESR